jgi:hypothetical protein
MRANKTEREEGKHCPPAKTKRDNYLRKKSVRKMIIQMK